MSNKPNPISDFALGVAKKRARFAVVRVFQEAYENAHRKYGFNRKDFAALIGMKPSEFSRILNGRQNVTFETAEAILRSLNHRLSIAAEDLDSLEPVKSNRIQPASSSPTAAGIRIDIEQAPQKTSSLASATVSVELDGR